MEKWIRTWNDNEGRVHLITQGHTLIFESGEFIMTVHMKPGQPIRHIHPYAHLDLARVLNRLDYECNSSETRPLDHAKGLLIQRNVFDIEDHEVWSWCRDIMTLDHSKSGLDLTEYWREIFEDENN